MTGAQGLIISGSVWPLAVLVWPLILGLAPLLPATRPLAPGLLALAPLPALGLALAGAPGTTLVPDLMLGVALAAGPGGALLLGMTAAVWAVAGWHAACTLQPGRHTDLLCGFWCLTLAGNLGVFLAADIVTFYLAFAAVSLAAWFLVVHTRSEPALRAGRVYILLAVIGEVALLAGLMIGASAADSLRMQAVRDALPGAPLGGLGIGLLVAGFGIKAGLVPLHVWLPLAHPAAPVPGSAVLSGAIVKAGLIGMLVFLPAGSGWAQAVIIAGMTGAFASALWGLTQRNPKAVLAYSTISQMGLMLALAGTGSGMAAFYALHHGLAKGALFLLVGVLATAATPGQRRATLALAAVIAASVAGLALTGGALVKLAAKDGLGPQLALAVTLSGVSTTLVLAWLLERLIRAGVKPESGARWALLFPGAAILGVAALVLPWLLWSGAGPLPPDYPLRPGALTDGIWPILLGLAGFAVIRRLPLPDLPPGDLLALGRVVSLPRIGPLPQVTNRPFRLLRHGLRLLRLGSRAEAALLHWPTGGSVLFVAVLVLAVLLS